MSLETLMSQLRSNAMDANSRREEANTKLRAAAASFAIPSPKGGGGGGGGGSYGTDAMPGKAGKGNWPAVGERHQHTSGYDYAKWSGDINVAGSGDFGNPVSSYQNGVVSSVKKLKDSYGKHVRVKHPNGTETLYAHLSKINVRPGQKVRGGQKIGRVGSTGNSTGPHLHFEIR